MKDSCPRLIILVIVLLVAIGLATWVCFRSKSYQPYSPASSNNASNSSASVEFGEHAISLSVPSTWGSLVTWNVGDRGNLVEGLYRKQDVLRGGGFGELGGVTRNFSDYPYMSVRAPKSNVAANVSLSFYPEKFSDDFEKEYGSMTKKQKEAAFQPLLQIYDQRGIDALKLEQKLIISPNDESARLSRSLRGLWWGNVSAVDDKVSVKYFENADGSLRGVGFFDFSTQEPGYGSGTPTYQIILINPGKRMLVTLNLPIDEFKELEQFYDRGNEYGLLEGMANKDGLKQEYAYLEDESNYQDTELGKFMRDIQVMIQSIKITE